MNKFNFSIYRKPLKMCTMILNYSSYPFSQKVSYFNSFLYILECIVPNKLYYKNKKFYIFDIGLKNNFDTKFIQKKSYKVEEKFYNPNYMLSSKKLVNYFSIKYHLFLFENFANIFYKNYNNVKITFKTCCNSFKFFFCWGLTGCHET